MRLIKSRIPRTSVPVLDGGFTANFVNYQAVVPQAVAAELLMRDDFFTDAGPVAEAVKDARVLVVRDTGLGDVLMTTPLIRKLATESGATVDVLTLDVNRCLFNRNPHVGEAFALDGMTDDAEAVLFARYDVVIDLRLVVENAEALGDTSHRADAFAAYGGFTLTEAERRPDLFLEDYERDWVAPHCSHILQTRAERKGIVGYVWASSKPNRNWSDDTNIAVIEALASDGYAVLIMGDKSIDIGNWIPAFTTKPDSPVVDLMGQLPLREAIAALSHCDAVITPDTGLFHAAAALGLPTLTYFGAFPVAERSAHSFLSVINDASVCGASPCRSYNCLNRDEAGQPVCLSVSPASVVARTGELLEKERQAQSRLLPMRLPDANDTVGADKAPAGRRKP